MHYDWDFNILAPYRAALLRGVWISIALGVGSSLIGTLVGVIMGGVFDYLPLKKVVLTVNDALRSIPHLVLIFFFYYFPYKDVFGVRSPSAFWCALAALALSQAVFTAELVRAAKHTVSQGPILAARALGVPEHVIWSYITLPDIMRQILPSLVAFWIGNLKISSLASVIGVEDVVFVAKIAVGQQYRSLEAWVVVALVYVVLVTPFTIAARHFEGTDWLKRRA
jgi:polar amino acid transport system permease protein